ncbi:MAG TPA: hypothetical protein VF645_14315 [Allosphingosinicella sp.]|jgi:hypothetical protein
MRIIYWLALALGTAAIASAAPARPATGSFIGAGPKAGGPIGGGHHMGPGGGFRFGPGRWDGDRRHRPDRRRSGRHGWSGYGLYGGVGIAGPVGAVDPHGNGFFNGGGGRIGLRDGRPYYDYDRSYPYEWNSAAASGHVRDEREARPVDRAGRCTMENGVRVCRGW